MIGGAAKMAADVKWCASCQQVGVQSRLRIMQINMEEAALICTNPQCTDTSTKIISRSASRLNVIKRKKQRLGVSSPSSVTTGSPMSPAPNQPSIHNGIPGSTNTGTIPSLPSLKTQLWEDKVVQWQNKDALCWLDVSMCVLVHCTSLRLCLRRLGEASLLHDLCNEFDNAQTASERSCVVEGAKERTDHDRLRQNGHACLSTSQNQLHSQSMQSMTNLEPESALEWLVMSDAEGAKQQELYLANKAKQLELDAKILKEKEKRTAENILENIREKVWKSLEVKLDLKLQKEETPVFALPLLCRLSGAMEEHFMTRYRWEFFCSACSHSDITVCSKAMISFTELASDFTLLSPVILKTCPVCKAPAQRSQLVYHSLPSCLMFQFSQGSPTSDVNAYNFKTESSTYEISSLVQYISNPVHHFIAWVRDTDRNMWLKCNDLEPPVCHWQDHPPSIPSSEIHIVIMEKQGEPCERCDAMNSEMSRIKVNVDQLVDKLAVLNGTSKRLSAPPVPPVAKVANVVDNSSSRLTSNGRLTLWKRRASSFQSYTNASKTTTPNHVGVIDLDEEGNENSFHSAPGSIDGIVADVNNKVDRDKSGSRSSSPSLESFSRSRKRSLPNYLISTGHVSKNTCKIKTKVQQSSAPIHRTKEEHGNEDGVSLKNQTDVVTSTAAGIKYGNSNVYRRRDRSNGKVSSKHSYHAKTIFQSYTDSQALKTNTVNPSVPEPTLPNARLPEGAFVRYSAWNRKGSKSDRSTSNSPTELRLNAKSLHSVSQIARPRCNSLSSQSSPSACSDLSSVSDTMSTSSNSSKDDLGSTIDELYKALEIGCATSNAGSRIPSPTVDDDFLAQILADDPVCASLGSAANNSGINIKVRSAPSVGRARPSGQELDVIMPSIEPMADDLLAELVA